MLIRATVFKKPNSLPLGLQNSNDKKKKKGILVVVVK